MPYVDQRAREGLAITNKPMTPGGLNYLITKMCLEFVAPNKTYDGYNEVIGVLECAKLEFYRRAVAVYEDLKKELNGDVY